VLLFDANGKATMWHTPCWYRKELRYKEKKAKVQMPVT
jgi:hypothetical protein